MFDEISTEQVEYQSPQSSQTPLPPEVRQVDEVVAEVMMVAERTIEAHDKTFIRYIGQLILPSEEAFAHLDTRLQPLNYLATLNVDEQTGQHIIMVVNERPVQKNHHWLPHLVLLILTFFSTMFMGALVFGDVEETGLLFSEGKIFTGLPYAISIMLILGAHEMGHYLVGRYYKYNLTLPYFIPMPLVLTGTMGAVILAGEPIRNRKQLFDFAIAGPLGGLVFAIPILLIGIATAQIDKLPTEADCERDESQCGYMLEGNSLLYKTSKYLIHGKWLPSATEDMTLNQMAFAGWAGLLITALNLIPISQLDGGHVLKTMIGKRIRRLHIPIMIAIALLALNNTTVWLPVLFLLFLFGQVPAAPVLDEVTPLDKRRRILGIALFIILALIFVPSPIRVISLG
jgi:Zn-dependent protease